MGAVIEIAVIEPGKRAEAILACLSERFGEIAVVEVREYQVELRELTSRRRSRQSPRRRANATPNGIAISQSQRRPGLASARALKRSPRHRRVISPAS